MQVHLVFRACKCWRLWYLGLGGDVSSREPCQLSPETGNFCLQSGNSIVCGGQGTVIVVDCSIEHLINIVLKGMSGTSMRISQLNILVDIDCLKTWLALIRRSFWELSIVFETMRIVKELMEIWLNEVCDTLIPSRTMWIRCSMEQSTTITVPWPLHTIELPLWRQKLPVSSERGKRAISCD